MNGILDNFILPGEGTAEAIKNLGFKEQQVEPGVSRFMGHDKGVAYRFYVLAEYCEAQSKKTKKEVYDEIEMIEWMPDKYSRPVERVRLLPPELLALPEYEGDEPTGKYAESYIRFKKGLSASGTPLARWVDKNGKLMLSLADKAALEGANIFSVEQLAAQPRAKIEGKFSASIKEVFERAIQFINGAVAQAQGEKMAAELADERAKRQALEARLAALEASTIQSAAKKGGPKAKKAVVEDGEIKEG